MAAKLRDVIGALRGRIGKLPGNCAQNAASNARSSRATIMPVSASIAARQRDMVVERLEPLRTVRGSPSADPARRDHLQREVMISHHEFVAGERIERILELLGLRNREIARIRHSIELPLQQPLAGGFGKKCKGLRQHERNGADSSRLYMPTTVGVGYSLMPSIAADAGVARQCGIRSPRCRTAGAWSPGPRLTGPRGSGTRCHSPLTSKPKYSSSDEQPDVRPPIYAEQFGLVSGQRRQQRLRQLFAGIERFRELQLRAYRVVRATSACDTTLAPCPPSGR